MALDDHSVSEFCKSAAKSRDSVLKQLASGLLDRRYFKSCDLTGMEAPKIAEFQNEITTLLEKKKLSMQWNWASDSPGDTPYKAYDRCLFSSRVFTFRPQTENLANTLRVSLIIQLKQ